MGQCPFRSSASTTPPAPELTADLVEEILLRFPPSEPSSLVRAALVCEQWCRLISEPRFRRRFREFHLRSREFHHRTPPVMLGFFCTALARDGGGGETARFVPTSTFYSPRATDLRHFRALDARHGRVLLRCPSETVLVVWDPISDERHELPVPTRWGEVTRWSHGWNAAVLCAADGPCDHLDCHRGPFLVVFVDSKRISSLFISTYSSESGTWSDRIFPLLHPAHYVQISSSLPCAHVGNALYFASENSDTALKYDLCLQETSVISIPLDHCLVFPYVLTTTEDGRLRYTVLDRSNLYMWLWDDDKGPNVYDRWTRDRVIDLKMLLLRNAFWPSPRIVGFADGDSPRIVGFADVAGVIFLTTDDVHFIVDLNARKVKKVSKDIVMDKALPYMSFYTPALGAAFRGEGPSEDGSNA